MEQKPQQPTEILIEGRLYDTAKFKHPGGSILKFYSGIGDATLPFLEFHKKSPKAHQMLATLPNRPAPPPRLSNEQDAEVQARFDRLTRNYMKFHNELTEEGWFEPSPPHIVYRLTELLLLGGLATWLLIHRYIWSGAMLMGIVNGRSGWVMHEAGHYSLTGNTKIDLRLQEAIIGLGTGMSAGWWRSNHNKHHCAPQKLKHDVDLNTLPLVAFHDKVAWSGKNIPFVRWWIPFQAYTFYPLTCLLVPMVWHLFLHPRFMIRGKHWVDLFWCVLRDVAYYTIGFRTGATFLQLLGVYTLFALFGGIYLFGNFALSHTHKPVLDPDQQAHWAEFGANHTINITPTPLVDWWMGYLNYQIEHHLFPTMPQYRFTKLYPRTRKFFEENGLEYDCRGYWEATWDTIKNMLQVGTAFERVPKSVEEVKLFRND